MSTSLTDTLNSVLDSEFTGRLASQLGEPADSVKRGLHDATASLLDGLVARTGDPDAMHGIFNLVTAAANDGAALDNPAWLVGPTAASSPLSSLSEQFASSVLGSRSGAVTDLVAKRNGLSRTSVATLFRLASALVLGALGRRVRAGGLDVNSFTRSIEAEYEDIAGAAPAGLGEALGLVERVPGRTFGSAGVATEKSGKRRVWPIVATAGALALLWAIWPKGRREVVTIVEPPRQTISGGEVVPRVEVPPTPGITLPGGTVIVVDPGSPEEGMVGFLKGPGPVDESNWFVLNRMPFETNSAKLSPESNAEIQDIVEVMKAFPNTRVRIGGFTDNTGSEAANLRLSRQRANSVRRALLDAGVAASRVEAKGFGSKHPIADNSTEEGRARNRRIGLLITRK